MNESPGLKENSVLHCLADTN